MPPRIIEDLAELRSIISHAIGPSDWFRVDQPLIRAFAEATEDRQWIHLDAERCRTESPYGTTIAHGFLTLALLSRLHAETVQVRGGFRRAINYGLNRVRFPAPVPAGSRIRSRSTLQAVEEVESGVQLTWLLTVEVEGQPKPALVAEWLVRLYR